MHVKPLPCDNYIILDNSIKFSCTEAIQLTSIACICNFGKDHYQDLLNCGNSTVNEPYVREYLWNDTVRYQVQDLQFTYQDVQNAISKSKNNKSDGLDSLHGDHYEHAGSHLNIILCMLFNAILNHSYIYIPESLMSTVIIPIIKNKKGNHNQQGHLQTYSFNNHSFKDPGITIIGYHRRKIIINFAAVGRTF